MFENWCRSCTGESLEISQEMAEQNGGDSTLIDNDTDVSTAMMLHSQQSTNDDSIIVEFNNEKFDSNNHGMIKKKKTTKNDNLQIKMKQAKLGQEKKQYAR